MKQKKNPNTITILCLGESTTDEQWPPILQKILNEKSKNKNFKVIDEGHASKNTEYLFYEVVEKKLLKYNPDIVISMMGINDSLSNKPYIMQHKHFYYKLRIYRLIILIKDHLLKKVKYTELNNVEKNINIPNRILKTIEEIAENTYKQKAKKNLLALKEIIKDYNDIHWYEHLIPALINPYFDEYASKSNNIFSLKDFLNYYNINIKHLELGKIYILFAKKFFENRDIDNAVICAKTALLYEDCYNSIKEIMVFDKPEIETDKINNNLEDTVNQESITKKIYNYTICYILNYNNNIKYIAMQYPTLSIESLKNDLTDNPFYNKIIFISNEENFKQVLKDYKTDKIFRDMFCGSFGHCTDLGNTIIAEKVADTILNLYN